MTFNLRKEMTGYIITLLKSNNQQVKRDVYTRMAQEKESKVLNSCEREGQAHLLYYLTTSN